MPSKEATARIKINKLLEAAGWRFFMEGGKPANKDVVRLAKKVISNTAAFLKNSKKRIDISEFLPS